MIHATPHSTNRHSHSAMNPLNETVITDTSVRSSRWFLTINGPWASSLYTAMAIATNVETVDNPPDTVTRYTLAFNAAGGIDKYFKNSDVAVVWELAPTTNHYHLHLAIHNQSKFSRRQLFDLVGPCDARVMAGKPSQSHDYLSKSGNTILYVGNQSYWKASQSRAASTTDWHGVMRKALECSSYTEFMRRFVTCDTPDEDCLKASLTRASWVMALIAAKSTPKRATTFTRTAWQADMLAIAYQPPENSHRVIYNIWSSESGTGKSTLADIIRNDNIPVFVFPGNLKMHDAIYMYGKQPVIIVDLARHASIENSGVYEVLEILSDQRVCSSGKYNGKSVRWLSHVFVLSNTKLDPDRLPGRFRFIEVKPIALEQLEDVALTINFDD